MFHWIYFFFCLKELLAVSQFKVCVLQSVEFEVADVMHCEKLKHNLKMLPKIRVCIARRLCLLSDHFIKMNLIGRTPFFTGHEFRIMIFLQKAF